MDAAVKKIINQCWFIFGQAPYTLSRFIALQQEFPGADHGEESRDPLSIAKKDILCIGPMYNNYII